jgi:predicted RNase H-like HicB family nuclease
MSDDRAYRIALSFHQERGRFIARVPELGLEAEGETRAQAIADAEAAIERRVEAAAVEGAELPRPVDHEPAAGELHLTLAPQVHRDLIFAARNGRMSPEQLAAQLLALALGASEGRSAAPARARAPRDGDEQPREREARDHDDARGNRASPAPAGNRRDGGRDGGRRRQEGYRPDLDDKANFLAYVRELEKGRGGGGGGRGGRDR